MQVLRVIGLPAGALAAAAAFYAQWLPELVPPRYGEVAARSADGGGSPSNATSRDAESPHHHPSGGPAVAQGPRLRLPRAGEDILLVFPAADHTHHDWRLAAVQQLARDSAPARVNAVAADDEAAIAAAARYLAEAPGLTGQLLALDIAGAGPVVS